MASRQMERLRCAAEQVVHRRGLACGVPPRPRWRGPRRRRGYGSDLGFSCWRVAAQPPRRGESPICHGGAGWGPIWASLCWLWPCDHDGVGTSPVLPTRRAPGNGGLRAIWLCSTDWVFCGPNKRSGCLSSSILHCFTRTSLIWLPTCSGLPLVDIRCLAWSHWTSRSELYRSCKLLSSVKLAS